LASHTSPTRLTFLSHAATPAQRRAAFPSDEDLEKPDFAAALGWKAPRAQQIWAGPEHRTRQTARGLGLSVEISAELRDCDYGSWRGLDLSEIQAQDPEGLAAWLTDPAAAPHAGESILKLIDRIGDWLEQQRDKGHTIAVTHPAVIRAAIIHVLEAPPRSFWRVDIAPLSLTDLRFNGRAWTVRSVSQILHNSDGTNAD
jgi:broad specificity phosphatase PhoE